MIEMSYADIWPYVMLFLEDYSVVIVMLVGILVAGSLLRFFLNRN